MEKFVDEDTNEEVEFLCTEILEGTTFTKEEGEQEALIQELFDAKESMSDEELEMGRILLYDIYTTPLALELVRRGKENTASYIRDPKVLLDLCEKGNKYAARELYKKFRCGDEEHGNFIDKEKAKKYYDLARDILKEWDEWDDNDDAGEEFPEPFIYELSGDHATLNAVSTLIDDLCQRYGTPDNECGLFVPQQILMKTLVGSDSVYYRGNIMRKEFTSDTSLVIETESDNGEPLLYALRQCYENLSVEMKTS